MKQISVVLQYICMEAFVRGEDPSVRKLVCGNALPQSFSIIYMVRRRTPKRSCFSLCISRAPHVRVQPLRTSLRLGADEHGRGYRAQLRCASPVKETSKGPATRSAKSVDQCRGSYITVSRGPRELPGYRYLTINSRSAFSAYLQFV